MGLSNLLEYYEKKFGPSSDEAIGEAYELWNRDDELADRVADFDRITPIGQCDVPEITPRFNKRGISGDIVPVVFYNPIAGKYACVDPDGRIHTVPEACDGRILGDGDGEGLFLIYHIRYTATDEEVDSLILAAEARDLYIGRILVDPWPEAGRADYQVYVKDGATRFPFISDNKNTNTTYVKKNFEHQIYIPPRYYNRNLYVRTAGAGVTGDTIFDVFVYGKVKPADVTYIIA